MYVTFDGATRQETVVYSGPAPEDEGLAFAPEVPYAALAFEREDYSRYTDIYDSEGHLLWTSQDQFPAFNVELGLALTQPWPRNARWAHLVVSGGRDAWDLRTLSVDLETGETRLAPEEGARLVSVSPDSVWWIYVIDGESEQLIAYNWQSGDLTALYDEPGVYQPGRFDRGIPLVWKSIDAAGGN
jgi:hypothetical protein